MKILELFAGSRSIGKAAEELGHEVFSTDIHPFEGIDLVLDVLEIEPNDIPFVPDVIWASPPCTGFSVAAACVPPRKPGQDPKRETSTT